MGCPDIEQPRNARLKRTDSRLDITCDTSNDKWSMTCVGHKWEGDIGVCPEGKTPVTRSLAHTYVYISTM